MVWGSSAGSMVCGVSVISVLLLEWCVSPTCRPTGSAVQPAAVDRQDRSGYIGGFVGQEEGDHVRHLLCRAMPAALPRSLPGSRLAATCGSFSTGVIVSSLSFLGTTLRPPSAGESRGSYGFPAKPERPWAL